MFRAEGVSSIAAGIDPHEVFARNHSGPLFGTVTATPPGVDINGSTSVEILVANTLDDLEMDRLDVVTALRLIATAAYQAGCQDGERDALRAGPSIGG